MRQSEFTGGSAGRAVNVQVAPTPRNSSNRPRERELELKLAALQEDYADLHAALFDAAQVHRRLCAPRLVRPRTWWGWLACTQPRALSPI